MKRILFLAGTFFSMLITSISYVQAYANNFYKKDVVNKEKVTFLNQYKMKVVGDFFLHKNMSHPAIFKEYLNK